MARFVSELSALDSIVQYGVRAGVSGGEALYCVSVGAVNRLKALAEDGNIDRWVWLVQYIVTVIIVRK